MLGQPERNADGSGSFCRPVSSCSWTGAPNVSQSATRASESDGIIRDVIVRPRGLNATTTGVRSLDSTSPKSGRLVPCYPIINLFND